MKKIIFISILSAIISIVACDSDKSVTTPHSGGGSASGSAGSVSSDVGTSGSSGSTNSPVSSASASASASNLSI